MNPRKDDTYKYYHPENQHDDVFWTTALSLFSAAEMQPDSNVYMIVGWKNLANPNVQAPPPPYLFLAFPEQVLP